MPHPSKISDAFASAVERALDHLADDDWLGRSSPLAAPYFLGRYLSEQPNADTPAGRGRALRLALSQAAATLEPEQRQLLDAVWFRRDPYVQNVGVALQLNMAIATFYRQRVAAVEALSRALNARITPSLGAEQPVAHELVARDDALARALGWLRGGQSVTVLGSAGIGKSALGAKIAEQWRPPGAFWHTLRSPLTDNRETFVFALAHFLRERGATTTWRQLVADTSANEGPDRAGRIIALLRHDLAQLQPTPPLICVDEIDTLNPASERHASLIHTLDALRDSAPMLLLGQSPLIETAQQLTLNGLDLADFGVLFERACATLAPQSLARLHAATRGNPLLARLASQLVLAGEPATELAQRLSASPTIELILNRVWMRLGDDERALMLTLAVFHGGAPDDAFAPEDEALTRLKARQLVHAGPAGSVWLDPHLRESALRRAPAELTTALHLRAAEVRETRGEFTAAAYHYVNAGRPALAVWLWLNHRRQEIERGHATAANDIFSSVQADELANPEDRRALAMLRAEQALSAGDMDLAERELGRERWPFRHPFAPEVQRLLGDALEMQGRVEQALDHYRSAVEMLVGSQERQLTLLRVKQGYLYSTRLMDQPHARNEAVHSLWQAENFMGYVEELAGRYDAAHEHYERALELARQTDTPAELRARTLSDLGRLCWKTGQSERAVALLEESVRHAKEVGEPVKALYRQLNLSSAYLTARRFDEALQTSHEALGLAQAMKHSFLVAGLAGNAGEASFYLGRLDDAERFELLSLREEEEAHRPFALIVLGSIRRAQGRLKEARDFLTEAISTAERLGDSYAEASAWQAQAELLEMLGDPAGARAARERAHEIEPH